MPLTHALSHDFLRRLVEESLDAIMVWSPGGAGIVSWNKAAAHLYGYAADEAMGRIPHELLKTEAPIPLGELDAALLAGGEWAGPLVHMTKDGRRLEVESRAVILNLSPGPLVLEINRDVTQRNDSGRLLQIALDAAELGVRREDLETGAVYFDDRACEHYGFPPGTELSADDILGRVHPEDLAFLKARREEARDPARSQGRYVNEFRVVHPDGAVRWLRVYVTVQFDHEGAARHPVSVVGTSQDITEARQRAMDLRNYAERLRDADQRKDAFIAMLSHELRNPLAALRNSAFVLDAAPPDSPQSTRAKGIISRQIDHLAGIVDDLLNVSRIARGKLDLRREDVDLVELIHALGDDYRAMMTERGLRFRITTSAQGAILLHGDRTRLTQAFGNLLQNAAKFCKAGDEVTLSVLQREGDVEVSVTDNGSGIDADLLPTLFEPFTQGRQTLDRAEGGLGLGLALVKGIAELHGGTVSAASAGPGKGAQFVVQLPAGNVTRDHRAPETQRPLVPGKRHRILVVEDNHDTADSLAALLRTMGQDADIAYDGWSAVDRCQSGRPDIVLCDIGLPGMDGYEVAKEIRRRCGDNVRLIAVTGYAQPEDVARGLEAGFEAHLAKPPTPAQIYALLQ